MKYPPDLPLEPKCHKIEKNVAWPELMKGARVMITAPGDTLPPTLNRVVRGIPCTSIFNSLMPLER
jgi:hypothetical protein